MKVKLEGVQETLLIPLVARAHETKEKNPRVVDYYAVEMISKIDCDWKKFQKKWKQSRCDSQNDDIRQRGSAVYQ